MKNLMSELKTAAHKRRSMHQTYYELRHMSRATAIDLGLFPEDAYQMAHRAVYGR